MERGLCGGWLDATTVDLRLYGRFDMARRRRVIGTILFLAALLTAAFLGTALGSTSWATDEWACPKEQVASVTYALADTGGYSSIDEALADMPRFLADAGERTESEYADAIASRSGPDRYEPDTGKIVIKDKVEAQLAIEQLNDKSWAPALLTICGPSAPAEPPTPSPTPGADA